VTTYNPFLRAKRTSHAAHMPMLICESTRAL